MAKVDLVTAAVDLVVVVDSGEVGEISWGLGKWNEEEGRGWTAMEVVVVLVVVVGHGVRGVAISWAVDRWRIAQQGKARQEAVGMSCNLHACVPACVAFWLQRFTAMA